MKTVLKTPKQIAEIYGFCASYIRKLICQGTIKAEKMGRFYVVNPNDVKLYRRRHQNKLKKDHNHGSNK